MRRRRLPGPDRASFLGGVVANREDKVKRGGARLGKFLPAFAAQARGGHVRGFELAKRFRTNSAAGVAPRAVCPEQRPAFLIQNGFRHDRTCRIPGAQKQNVVRPLHKALRSPASCSTLERSILAAERPASRRE